MLKTDGSSRAVSVMKYIRAAQEMPDVFQKKISDPDKKARALP